MKFSFETPDDDTQALQLGFELALRERDAVLRENARAVKEKNTAMQQYHEMRHERDQALASLDAAEIQINTIRFYFYSVNI